MALCPSCGKNLSCSCGAPKPASSPEQPCPLKKGAIWVHVLDDAAGNITGATVKRGGDSKPSNGDGLAIFDPLDAGTYEVELSALGVEDQKKYELPTPLPKQSSVVSNGEIAYIGFEVKRKPALKVKVVKKGDPSKLFANAVVTVSGKETPGDKNSGSNGIADIGFVAAGSYTVKVTLSTEDAKAFATTIDFSKETEKVELTHGQDKTVEVFVEDINVVVPKVELEYKAVLCDTEQYKKQSGERPIRPCATYVQLSLTQSNLDHPFAKEAAFTCSPANVEMFLDELCTKAAPAKLTAEMLKGADSKPFKLYLRGKTVGKIKAKLTLDDAADRFIKLDKNPTPDEELGVVKIEFKLFQHDKAEIDKLEVDPDTDPVGTYYTNLNNQALPEPVEMKPEARVGEPKAGDAAKPGRLLHVQSGDGDFGRAKLVCKKIDFANLPDGCADYFVTLAAGLGTEKDDPPTKRFGGDDDKPAPGAVKFFDAETAGSEQTDIKVKFSALKDAEKTFWVEGAAETEIPCGLRVHAGMDRDAGGLEKTAKRNADWARFTVIKIQEVKVDYTVVANTPNAWDSAENRFYINFQADPDGRKITIGATLTKALKNVDLHFLLGPHKDNLKAANWGLDLPGTWKWKDISADLKHSDKADTDRKKLLHYSEKTDDKGYAKKELLLSRFGGDKFFPAAYILQDAHLCKWVHGHTDLGKRKPVQRTDAVEVYRRFWYQMIEVAGVTPRAVAGAVGQYKRVKADMKAATPKTVSALDLTGMPYPALYKRYMVKANGGNTDVLVISDMNKDDFFDGIVDEADKPVKVPILVCDAQWDTGPDTSAVTTGWLAYSAYNVTCDRLILQPALEGGDILVSGAAQLAWEEPLGTWVTSVDIPLDESMISISPTRADCYKVKISMAPGVNNFCAGKTNPKIKFKNLVVKGCKGPYLGESFDKKVLSVYDPNEAADFQNTIAHEIGHGFGQVVESGDQPDGAPVHPNQYISVDTDGDPTGSHCSHATNKCVMYQSGPITGSLNRFCDICHPYMLACDMSTYS